MPIVVLICAALCPGLLPRFWPVVPGSRTVAPDFLPCRHDDAFLLVGPFARGLDLRRHCPARGPAAAPGAAPGLAGLVPSRRIAPDPGRLASVLCALRGPVSAGHRRGRLSRGGRPGYLGAAGLVGLEHLPRPF